MILFLFLPFLCALLYLFFYKKFDMAGKLSHVSYLILIGSILYQIICYQHFSTISFEFLSIHTIHLVFVFMCDKLSLMMLLLIGLIGWMVNSYAVRYVYSDLNRSRFMFQLSLTVCSVILFILSGNLLTAFIGWQLIGFNLYWMLNHYHYDEQANRAAKKKFAVNRIGDVSFLCAIIICIHYYGTTSFNILFETPSPIVVIFNHAIPVHALILSCIFIAVMTKSAQFPFHIWLPDTMRTPTPVSAIMHAGVINAGGYLLARLAPLIIEAPVVQIFIISTGILTLFLGSLFSLYQSDVKKQLAYSTMSQMGYMVMQCGLGCFIGAIFHLMAHGFFKAWSFLNVGNQLSIVYINKKPLDGMTKIAFLCMSLLFLGAAIYLYPTFYQMVLHFPVLGIFFFITLYELTLEAYKQSEKIVVQLVSSLFILGLLLCYAALMSRYEDMIASTLFIPIHPLVHSFQYFLIAVVAGTFILYRYFIEHKRSELIFSYVGYLVRNKLFIEELYRHCLLQPIRYCGDIFYNILFEKYTRTIFIFLLFFFSCFAIGHMLNGHFMYINSLYVAWISMCLINILLLAANRARRLEHILLCLIVSQYILAMMLGQSNHTDVNKIFYFQLIHTTLLALMMSVIVYKIKTGKKLNQVIHNKLPALGAYLTTVLFCLIGLPFTPFFVSELVILKELMILDPLLMSIFLVNMGFFALVILHTLQDYIFKASAISELSIHLSPMNHLILMGVLLFHFLNGLYPAYILSFL